MADLDKLRDKITNYHSPLSIEDEWNSFAIKQENIVLQQKVKRKNRIIILTALLGLLLIGTCAYQNHFQQKSNVLSGFVSQDINQNEIEAVSEKNLQTLPEESDSVERTAMNEIESSLHTNISDRAYANNQVDGSTISTSQVLDRVFESSEPSDNRLDKVIIDECNAVSALDRHALILSQENINQVKQDQSKSDGIGIQASSRNQVYTKNLIAIDNLPIIDLSQFHTNTAPFLVPEIEILNSSKEELNRGLIYVEPNISLGLLHRVFKSDFSGADEYLAEKASLETPILHNAISFEFGMLLKRQWSLQLGIEYQEMRELFRFNEFRNINKHKYLTIPFNVGKKISVKNTELYASGGLSYALTHSFTGLTKSGQNSVRDVEGYFFKNRIGFQISLGSEYSISNRQQLFLKTIVRKSPTLTFGDGLEKFHFSYSLGIGLRHYL